MKPLGGHTGPRNPRHPLVGPGGHQADLQGKGGRQKRLLELQLAFNIASLIWSEICYILLPILMLIFALSGISYPRVPSIDLSEMSVQVVTVNKKALDVVATVPNEDMVVKIVK